jgi:glucokinase
MGMDAPVVIAVDVGGTGMKCALVRPDGKVHHAERHPTQADRGPAVVIANILDVATGLADRARADGLDPVAAGVAVPGVVDEAAGVAVWSANVGFRDEPLRDLVAARLGVPAALGHDVRAGGTAEARLGAGRDQQHVLFVAIGTGIAAAHVVDGRAFAGAHGAAGEVGHVIVRPGGAPCGCGGRGCLETVASASAIGRRYAEEAGVDGATAFDVAARAAAGEARAVAVWTDAVDALADGLLTAQALYDAEVIVLGGGLAEAGEALLGPLRTTLGQRITFHRVPRLVQAALGDTAGCLGAALLALDAAGRARDTAGRARDTAGRARDTAE